MVFTWPLNVDTMLDFCEWAASSQKLKATTIKTYMSSLATLHKLQQLPDNFSNNYVIKLAIRGAENLELYNGSKFSTRRAVSLPLLKIIGSAIANTKWSIKNKQVFWTACVVAFFGSFRMGELLSKFENKYDPATTFLWSDLKLYNNHCVIHVKSPKSRVPKGEFVDIFEFLGHNCCPIKALAMLKSLLYNQSCEKMPVFTFDSGKFLTKESLNFTLKNLLNEHIGSNSKHISSHSFRAGIPSTLAKFPDLFSDKQIMGWGRWRSDAYSSYTKLKYEQKKCIFGKIANVLNKL